MVRQRRNEEKIIKAIYVFNKKGNCLAKYTTLPKDAMSLTIMNTIEDSFGNMEKATTNNSSMNVFDGRTKMYHKNRQNVTVAMICSNKLPEKAASHLLNNISHKFINMYSGKMEAQNGNSEIFEGFQQILEGCCYSDYLKILMREFSH